MPTTTGPPARSRTSLLADILAHPDHQTMGIKHLLVQAEKRATLTQRAFHSWDYVRAVLFARQAYESLATAADELGIGTPTEAATLLAVPTQAVQKDIDYIRDPAQ